MKKIFITTAILVASLFISVPKTEVFAQESKGNITQVGFKDYFKKGKTFSKDKWKKFKENRGSYFSEPFEAKGLTFTDVKGQKIDKVYFSISTKLRFHPLIKLVDEDGKDVNSAYVIKSTGSEFKFIDVIGYSRAETPYAAGVNILLPNEQYYVLARRIPKSGNNSEEQIWPVPVSKNEFKRLKSLKTSAIGEKVTPIDGYNY